MFIQEKGRVPRWGIAGQLGGVFEVHIFFNKCTLLSVQIAHSPHVTFVLILFFCMYPPPPLLNLYVTPCTS